VEDFHSNSSDGRECEGGEEEISSVDGRVDKEDEEKVSSPQREQYMKEIMKK
jgi:hypothetical protein